MANWRIEQYADMVNKKHQVLHPMCKQTMCPKFQTCTQVPSHGFLGAKAHAKIFFVTDAISEEEAELSTPNINVSGKILRENFIAPFVKYTKLSVPYLITKTFRAFIEGKSKVPKTLEASLCFSLLQRELEYHKPEVVVAFGVSTFSNLYHHATNKEELPVKDEHSLNLRGKFFDFKFGKVTTKVYLAYSPGLVATKPASLRYLKEDVITVASKWNKGLEKSLPETLEIKNVTLLTTAKDVFDYLDFLKRSPKVKSIAFDTELEGLNRRWNNKFLTWQFSHADGEAVVVPIEHSKAPLFKDPDLKKKLRASMMELFNIPEGSTSLAWFIAHNAKFDLSVMWGLEGIFPRARNAVPWWCALLGMHWLDENRKALGAGSPYSLKTLGTEFFNFKFEDESLEKRGDGALEELSLEQLADYGGSDAILTRALAKKQFELAKLQPDNALKDLIQFQKRYYFPASKALAVMECNGLYLDRDQLKYLQSEVSPIWSKLTQIEHDIQNLPEVLDFRKKYKEQISGKSKTASTYESLWDSHEEDVPLLDLNKQEHQHLFYLEYLKLKPLRFSKKTQVATLDNNFLEKYSSTIEYRNSPTIKAKFHAFYSEILGYDEKDGSPIYRDNPIKLAIEYRKLKKLGTSYLDSMEGFILDPKGDSVDGRIRASYNLHGTDTGRMCLTSQTKILTVGNITDCIDGVPIKDVKVGDLVYCYDDARQLQVKKVLWSGKTGKREVVRLHWKLDNNKGPGYLDLTPEHPVRLFSGEYRKACELLPGDRLLSLSRSVSTMNKKRTKKYARLNCFHGQLKEHRFVFELFNGYAPELVHHQDGNSLNNSPSNLKEMAVAEHTSEHWSAGVFDARPTKGEELQFCCNHEVVRIEYLPGEVDVYDLEVEDTHNFIANEICVHNSSQKPNLQQLPSGKIKVAKDVKNMFQAEPGNCLIQGDYKTAEVRWAALFSRDSNLISVFSEAARIISEAVSNDSVSDDEFKSAQVLADLHSRTASLMFGVPADKVPKSQRQSAKCLVGSTLLYTNKGIIPIESLVTDKNDNNWLQPVTGVTTASKGGETKVKCINHKWVDKTIELETDLGIKIEGDEEHPLVIWRNNKFEDATFKEIHEGDYLVVPRSNAVWVKDSPVIELGEGPKQMCLGLARLLGYLVAGEAFKADKASEPFHDLLDCLGCFGDMDFAEIPVYMKKLGAVFSGERCVPEIIFRSRREEVSAFLRAYFECAGNIIDGQVVVRSESKTLMLEIQQLLLALNIISILISDGSYGLQVDPQDVQKFAHTVGFVSKGKQEQVLNIPVFSYDTTERLSPVMRKTIKTGRQKVYDIEVEDDSHTFQASGILSKNCITFGLLFGMTVKTLAARNGWSLEEGEEKLQKYFSAFPGLEKWLKNIPHEARKKGYVKTFMGRRRRLEHLFAINEWKFQTDAERKAMNSSIQGQSSDGGTIGMFLFMQYIFDNNLEDRWLVQNIVHDSCLVQCPLEDIETVLEVMKKCFVADMQSYIETHWKCSLPIPIEMEFELGLGYGSLTPWDGRQKTLKSLVEKIREGAKTFWKPKVDINVSLPPKSLDLVVWEQNA